MRILNSEHILYVDLELVPPVSIALGSGTTIIIIVRVQNNVARFARSCSNFYSTLHCPKKLSKFRLMITMAPEG
jgi:hypothetical protein